MKFLYCVMSVRGCERVFLTFWTKQDIGGIRLILMAKAGTTGRLESSAVSFLFFSFLSFFLFFCFPSPWANFCKWDILVALIGNV